MKRVYLDHSATTPVDPSVAEVMYECMVKRFGNPSSIHSFGRDAKPIFFRSQQEIASLLNCHPEEIYFTSGGTEADNLALFGYALEHGGMDGHIVISNIEHPAVERSAAELETLGFSVKRVPADEYGEIKVDAVEATLTSKTVLVSIMHVNNEVGTVNDLTSIGQMLSERDVCFHTDAVQSFGKVPIDVQKMSLDLLSLSAHKFYGPKGIGALYVRNGIALKRRIFGGSQQNGVRSGTENVPGIAGIGKAASICSAEMQNEYDELIELRKMLLREIRNNLDGVHLNGHPTERLPGNVNVRFDGVNASDLLIALDMDGIAASAGSACASGSVTASSVLTAIGLTEDQAASSIRFTLGRSNNREDIMYAGNMIIKNVNRLRVV